jgi:hypothetical protein
MRYSIKKILFTVLSVALLFSVVQVKSVTAETSTSTATTTLNTSTSSASIYTRSLGVGSNGADVAALQTFLEVRGYVTFPAGTSSKGYFGSLTQVALAKYQASMGIAPANGYFGPITRAKVIADTNALTVTPYTPPSTAKKVEINSPICTSDMPTSGCSNWTVLDQNTTIGWRTENIARNAKGYIYIKGINDTESQYKMIAEIRGKDSVYTWKTGRIIKVGSKPKKLTPGEYQIMIKFDGAVGFGFWTIKYKTTDQPNIVVGGNLSGGTLKLGENYNITWVDNQPTQLIPRYQILLEDEYGFGQGEIANSVTGNSFVWSVGRVSNANGTISTVATDKKYIIRVLNKATGVRNDRRSGMFTIVASSTVATSSPVISSINPMTGNTGTQVTLTGTGFTSTGNSIRLNGTANWISNLTSNGTSLSFNIPTYYPNQSPVNPGNTLYLSVQNTNGTSNEKIFTIAASTSAATTTATTTASTTNPLIVLKPTAGTYKIGDIVNFQWTYSTQLRGARSYTYGIVNSTGTETVLERAASAWYWQYSSKIPQVTPGTYRAFVKENNSPYTVAYGSYFTIASSTSNTQPQPLVQVQERLQD